MDDVARRRLSLVNAICDMSALLQAPDAKHKVGFVVARGGPGTGVSTAVVAASAVLDRGQEIVDLTVTDPGNLRRVGIMVANVGTLDAVAKAAERLARARPGTIAVVVLPPGVLTEVAASVIDRATARRHVVRTCP